MCYPSLLGPLFPLYRDIPRSPVPLRSRQLDGTHLVLSFSAGFYSEDFPVFLSVDPLFQRCIELMDRVSDEGEKSLGTYTPTPPSSGANLSLKIVVFSCPPGGPPRGEIIIVPIVSPF